MVPSRGQPTTISEAPLTPAMSKMFWLVNVLDARSSKDPIISLAHIICLLINRSPAPVQPIKRPLVIRKTNPAENASFCAL